MKRYFRVFLFLTITFLIVGCGKSEQQNPSNQQKQNEEDIQVENNDAFAYLVCTIDDREVTFVLQHGKIFSYSDNKYGDHTPDEIKQENTKFEFIYTNEDAINWLQTSASNKGYSCIEKDNSQVVE